MCLCTEHLPPDPRDLSCPVSDVADPRLVFVPPLGVLAALVACVPSLIGPFEVNLRRVRGGNSISFPHLHVLAQRRQHEHRHLTHELVVGVVGDVEPRICSDLIRQPDHELDWNSVPPDPHRRIGCRPVGVQDVLDVPRVCARVRTSPMCPPARLHVAGPRPGHEAKGPVVFDALKVPGVEWELLCPPLEARHGDADVADGVVGEEAIVEHSRGLHLYLQPPDSSPHALDVRHGRRQDAVAIEGDNVDPSWRVSVEVPDHHGADFLVGLKAVGIVIVSQLEQALVRHKQPVNQHRGETG
eukprot:753838-Hanusia_phi.AAC.3